MSPWRGGRGDPAAGHSFWGQFLLFWLASSGVGTLLLFLFHYLYLTPPFRTGMLRCIMPFAILRIPCSPLSLSPSWPTSSS